MSPAIHTIINHYEIEIKKIAAARDVIKNKSENLIKTVKGLLNSLSVHSRKIPNFESLKADVLLKINEFQAKQFQTFDSTKKLEKTPEFLKASNNKYEKENKDLEDILRREKNIAEIYSDAINFKTNEINEFKQAMISLTMSDKMFFNSVENVSDSVCENCFSLISSPYGKNWNFEVSFNSKENFAKHLKMNEIFEKVEKPLINVWNSISLKIEEKYLGINQIVVNIKNLTLVYIKKINNLKEKLATKEAEIINLNETIENLNKKTLENQQTNEKLESEQLSFEQELRTKSEDHQKLLQKIAKKHDKINTFKETIKTNEEDKRLLNEKVINLYKEIEKQKKTQKEQEQLLITSQVYEKKLKELKEKHQISQIKYSELELLHKKLEQDLIFANNQLVSSNQEIANFKSKIVVTLSNSTLTDVSVKEVKPVMVFESSFNILPNLEKDILAKNKQAELEQKIEEINEEYFSLKDGHILSLEKIEKLSEENKNLIEEVKKTTDEVKELKNSLEKVNSQIELFLFNFDKPLTPETIDEILKIIESKKNLAEEAKNLNETIFELKNQTVHLIEKSKPLQEKSDLIDFLSSGLNKQITSEEISNLIDTYENEKKYILQIKDLNEEKSSLEEQNKSLEKDIENIVMKGENNAMIIDLLSKGIKKELTIDVINGLIESNNREKILELRVNDLTKLNNMLEDDNNKLTDQINSYVNELTNEVKVLSFEEITKIIEDNKFTESIKSFYSTSLNESISLNDFTDLNELLSQSLNKKTTVEEIKNIIEDYEQQSIIIKELQELQELSKNNESLKDINQDSDKLNDQNLETYKILNETLEKSLNTEVTIEDLQNLVNISENEKKLKQNIEDLTERNSILETEINTLNDEINALTLQSKNDSKSLIDELSQGISKEITSAEIKNLINLHKTEESLQQQIKDLTDQNSLLEQAYKKLTEEVKIFKDSYKEKIEDLTLDKYELVKDLDEQKKRNV